MDKSEELRLWCPVCRHVRDEKYKIKVDKEASLVIKQKNPDKFADELKYLRKYNFIVGEKGAVKLEVGSVKERVDKKTGFHYWTAYIKPVDMEAYGQSIRILIKSVSFYLKNDQDEELVKTVEEPNYSSVYEAAGQSMGLCPFRVEIHLNS